MENTGKIKKIIIGLLAVGALLLAWFFLKGDGDVPAAAPLAANDSADSEDGLLAASVAATEGREILDLLNDLQNLSLDETIFTDPVFLSLQDFSQELSPEPKGRPDPFAPIGEDVI